MHAKSVPWNPWWGAAFVILAYFGSLLAGSLLVSIYPFLKHWSQSQTQDWINNSVAGQFVYVLLAEALAVGAIYWFLRLYKSGFSSIGLRWPRWSDFGYGLLAAPVYFILLTVVLSAAKTLVPGLDLNQQQQIGFNSVNGGLELFLTFISLVILPPLAEEIMARGMLYGSLKKGLPVAAAALFTSLIFAAAHLPEGGSAGPLYVAALDTFTLSLILIYLREKTGGLWSSITLHALKNGLAFMTIFVLHAR